MTQTNGHAATIPATPPATPAERPTTVKVTLYIEIENDVGRTALEVGDDAESTAYMASLGWVRGRAPSDPAFVVGRTMDELFGSAADEVVGTTPSGEPVRMVGAERAEVDDAHWLRGAVADAREKMFGPNNARTTGDIALETVSALVTVLEVRLGRGGA